MSELQYRDENRDRVNSLQNKFQKEFIKFLRLDKDIKFQRKKKFMSFEDKQNFVMHNRMVQRK